MAQSRGKHFARGIAFIEFAILLPIMFVMFALFWDMMVERISVARHYSVATQLSHIFRPIALKASVVSSGSGLPDLQIAKIPIDPDLTSKDAGTDGLPVGFLPRLNALHDQLMSNIGTGASLVDHNVIVELWYLDICTTNSTAPECSTRPLGSAYKAAVAGDGTSYPSPSAQYLYALPQGDACLGRAGSKARKNIETAFTDYRNRQLRKILTRTSPPFGIKIIDIPGVDLGVPGVPNIDPLNVYSEMRAVLFLGFCSDPPRLFNSTTPVMTYVTFFLDKEIGF